MQLQRHCSADAGLLKLRARNQEGRLTRTRSDSYVDQQRARQQTHPPRVMVPETPHGKILRADVGDHDDDELELVVDDLSLCEEVVTCKRQSRCRAPFETSRPRCCGLHPQGYFQQSSCCCSAVHDRPRCSYSSWRRCNCENCNFDDNVMVSCHDTRRCGGEHVWRHPEVRCERRPLRTTRVFRQIPKDRSPVASSPLQLRTPLNPSCSPPVARRPPPKSLQALECVVMATPTKGLELSQFTQSLTPVPTPHSITKVHDVCCRGIHLLDCVGGL